MPYANESDFFGEGVAADAFAPLETPAQKAERQRLEDVRLAEERRRTAEATATRAAPYSRQRKEEDLELARQNTLTSQTSVGKAGNDWMYPGIVAGTILGGIGAAGAVGAAGAGAAAAPAFSAVGPAAGGVVTAGGAAAPTVLTAGGSAAGAAGLAGGAGAAAAAPWLTPGNAMAAGGLLLQGGALVANQIRTKAEKDLIKKQEEIAAAAEQRRAQVQQEGMNRLGQTMLAMNPMNQTMAEMFGPSAAYTPQQMAGMVADPGAVSQADAAALSRHTDPESQAKVERAIADRKRQQMVQANTTPLGPGPAPLQQRTPQAARRF